MNIYPDLIYTEARQMNERENSVNQNIPERKHCLKMTFCQNRFLIPEFPAGNKLKLKK